MERPDELAVADSAPSMRAHYGRQSRGRGRRPAPRKSGPRRPRRRRPVGRPGLRTKMTGAPAESCTGRSAAGPAALRPPFGGAGVLVEVTRSRSGLRPGPSAGPFGKVRPGERGTFNVAAGSRNAQAAVGQNRSTVRRMPMDAGTSTRLAFDVAPGSDIPEPVTDATFSTNKATHADSGTTADWKLATGRRAVPRRRRQPNRLTTHVLRATTAILLLNAKVDIDRGTGPGPDVACLGMRFFQPAQARPDPALLDCRLAPLHPVNA